MLFNGNLAKQAFAFLRSQSGPVNSAYFDPIGFSFSEAQDMFDVLLQQKLVSRKMGPWLSWEYSLTFKGLFYSFVFLRPQK